ncbi:MAG: 50S ribosomal protein L30 [Chloroflexi bacterium]|nr:50S ribosomal protein L30 [Chloroflexota bacterium]MCH8229423.1 50S ribosomal protein L30 [Chloroflexota bacterium]MCH8909895.1 50S ribosomal protein L30 [Chloroflexota bacterium]
MAKLRITQTRSAIGTKPAQRATLKALGLRRIRHEVVKEDNPVTRGMIKRVVHLVAVEAAE